METAYEDFLRDIVITIHMNIRELKERRNFADPEELSHIEAKLIAYEEVLAVLRSSADEFGVQRDEFGL